MSEKFATYSAFTGALKHASKEVKAIHQSFAPAKQSSNAQAATKPSKPVPTRPTK